MLLATLLPTLTGSPVVGATQAPDADEVLARAREVYQADGPRPALAIFKRALRLYRERGDREGEAITLGLIGNCHKRFGNYEEALDLLHQALAAKRELGDREEVGKTLSHLGLVHWEMGDYPTAVSYLQQSIDLARDLEDPILEGSALNNLSLVYDEMGEYALSLTGYERALELYRPLDFPRGESDTLANIGGVHLLLGRFREALGHYEKALAIDERSGSRPALSATLGNIALCHVGLGEVDEALEAFDRALDLAREAGLQQEEAAWLRGKANAFLVKGSYDLALELHRQALDLLERAGSRGEVVQALAELGELLLRLGDLAAAEDHFQRSLHLAERIGQDRGVTVALLRLGDLEWRREQYAHASRLYERALKRADAVGDRARTAESLLDLAAADLELGRLDAGLRRAEDALAIAEEEGIQPLEADALLELGKLERASGDPRRAIERLTSGEVVATEVGDPDTLWRLLLQKARTLENLGDRPAAVEVLQEAVDLIEGVRGRLVEDRFRAGYLEDKYEVYVELVRLLLESGRLRDAFTASERLRSRSLVELLDRAPVDTLSKPVERSSEIELRNRLRQLQRALEEERERPAPERRQTAIRAFSTELAATEDAYRRENDPGSSKADARHAIVRPAPSVAEVQALLEPGQALLEFVLGEEQAFVFVLTRDAAHTRTLAISRSSLRAKVELLLELLERTDSDAWRKPATSLGDLLIGPIEQEGLLHGIRELYLVPHRVLNLLPFAALLRHVDGTERLLVEDYVSAYLPSGAVLQRDPTTVDSSTGVLSLAPDRARLRYAQAEALGVARAFAPESLALTGARATEGSFKRLAPEFRTLHIVTHGEFNKLSPLLSGLQLEPSPSENGTLQVYEILGLRLHADLVTLSACETALASGYFSDLPAGDEFVGLSRAFLVAGSASVLSALWDVDDRSTLELMLGFYRSLQSQDKARSLALVQREMAREGAFRHPGYWAPFVLAGKM